MTTDTRFTKRLIESGRHAVGLDKILRPHMVDAAAGDLQLTHRWEHQFDILKGLLLTTAEHSVEDRLSDLQTRWVRSEPAPHGTDEQAGQDADSERRDRKSHILQLGAAIEAMRRIEIGWQPPTSTLDKVQLQFLLDTAEHTVKTHHLDIDGDWRDILDEVLFGC